MLWLLACTPPQEEKPLQPALGLHWEASGVRPCAQPQPVAWQEVPLASTAFSVPESNHSGPIEPGAVVWWEGEAGLSILSSSPDSELLVQDVSAGTLVHLPAHGPIKGMLKTDLDQDGQADLLTAEAGLWVRYAFTLEDMAAVQLLPPVSQSEQSGIAVGDIDGDGDLDIVVGYSSLSIPSLPYRVLRNEGGRRFSQELIEVRADFWGIFFDLQLVDIDRDGDLDILSCNDRGAEVIPNGVLENDGAGQFSVAMDDQGLGVPANCMSLALGDVDRDGVLDNYIGDGQHHWLLMSSNHGYYDAAAAWGLPEIELHEMVWGNAVVDVDNDGYTDLVANMGDFYMQGAVDHPLTVYHQMPSKTLSPWTPFPELQSGRGLVVVDGNQDGVPDILSGQGFRAPQLFMSEGCSIGNWLEVEAPSQSRVYLRAQGQTQVALASPKHGWQSSGPAVVHFGLGEVAEIEELWVELPGGQRVDWEGSMATRQRLRLLAF